MSAATVEQLRQALEDIETEEKAVAFLLAEGEKQGKNRIEFEGTAGLLLESVQMKSGRALDIITDESRIYKDEMSVFAGTKQYSSDYDPRIDEPGSLKVWNNFYQLLKEIKDTHRRAHQLGKSAAGQDNIEPTALASTWFDHYRHNNPFSATEASGKRVDMEPYYHKYMNLRTLKRHREITHQEAEVARLTKNKKTAEEIEILTESFSEIDLITFIKTFGDFEAIPRHCKYRSNEYLSYVTDIHNYLSRFFKLSNPLVDFQSVEDQLLDEYEKAWGEGSIIEWKEPTSKMPFYALPTDMLMATQGALDSHKGGKKYKKAVEKLQQLPLEDQSMLVTRSESHDRDIAKLEFLIRRYRELLLDVVTRTVEHLHKKQSRSLKELQDEVAQAEEEDMQKEIQEDEFEGSEEKTVYNPLNLPLGYDGKPIPYWLYKLHGLGEEYACEICGNCSYWGRRAFERHFQEWRHAFGMRCLKIPNTVHFKEITKIEDAISLYEKLKREAEINTFRNDLDVECEDADGNIMSAKAYEDLLNQGLV